MWKTKPQDTCVCLNHDQTGENEKKAKFMKNEKPVAMDQSIDRMWYTRPNDGKINRQRDEKVEVQPKTIEI